MWRVVAALAAFALVGFLPRLAVASNNPSFDAAMAACVAYDLGAYWPNNYDLTQGCRVSDQVVSGGGYVVKTGCFRLYSPTGSMGCRYGKDNGDAWANWYFSGAVPPPDDSACSAAPVSSGSFPGTGKILSGYSICVSTPAPSAPGGTVMCKVDVSPDGAPYLDPYSGAGWMTRTRSTNAHQLCGDGKAADGTVYDGNGDKAPGAPKVPAPLPANDGADSPKVCGGESCYDPNTDQYCAVAGGEQICVPGGAARGNPGSCVSGSSGTVCAGSPAPTLPNPPPITPISDPATQTSGIDRTTQANPQTGANQTVTTVTYGLPGTTVGSGAGSSDSQPPAPGTGTPGDPAGDDKGKEKGSASGGGDCAAPPACTGDQVMCMQVAQTWMQRCKPGFDQHEDGSPKWLKVPDAGSDGYGVEDTPVSSVVKPDGDGTGSGAGDGGIGQLDQTGFAGNACPSLPSFEVFGQSFTFPQDLFCDWLGRLRGIFLLVAAFVSARILASGGKA